MRMIDSEGISQKKQMGEKNDREIEVGEEQ